jgi:hypothetical protein
MNETIDCPVCKTSGCSKTSLVSKSNPQPLRERYECERCGAYVLLDKYGQLQELSLRQRALLSHTLRRMQRANGPRPEVSESILPNPNEPLPSPAEHADSLILWIGDYQPSHAQHIKISDPEL